MSSLVTTEPQINIYKASEWHGYDDHWTKDPSRDKPMYHHFQPTGATLKALNLPKQKTRAMDFVLARLIGDAIMTAHLYPGRWISYSRAENWHLNHTRIYGSEFTRHNVVNAIDAMVSRGIISEHKPQEPGRRGRQSRYLVNPNMNLFDMPEFVDEVIDPIQVRDADGKVVPYKDTTKTRRARRILNRYNDVLAMAKISFEGPGYEKKGDWIVKDGNHVCPARKSVYRVYTETLTAGGRIYGGHWQQVSSEDRQYFVIDGDRTVEVDYEQLHPRMVYSMAGIPLKGDAYTIPGWEHDRDTCKRAFNILLNARTYVAAKGALKEHMDGNGKAADRLLKAIKAHHQDIDDKKFFNSGIGLKLQNLDAEMCEFVLDELTVKRGIPVLSVHDSFIVAEGHRDLLVRTMVKAYDKHIGKTKRRIVKQKSSAVKSVGTSTFSVESHYNTVPPLRPLPSGSSLSAYSEQESETFNLDSRFKESETSPAHEDQTIAGQEKQDTDTVETITATVVEQEIVLQGRGVTEEGQNVSTVIQNDRPHLAVTQDTNTAITLAEFKPRSERKAIYRPRPQFLVREAERAEKELLAQAERKAKRYALN